MDLWRHWMRGGRSGAGQGLGSIFTLLAGVPSRGTSRRTAHPTHPARFAIARCTNLDSRALRALMRHLTSTEPVAYLCF
jgi:hypothetical protein